MLLFRFRFSTYCIGVPQVAVAFAKETAFEPICAVGITLIIVVLTLSVAIKNYEIGKDYAVIWEGGTFPPSNLLLEQLSLLNFETCLNDRYFMRQNPAGNQLVG